MKTKLRLATRIPIVCHVVLLLLATTLMAAPPGRVVAVGDVHGAYTEFLAVLQRTGLIDGNRQWTGGETTLIQIGDVVDRGPQVRERLDLLMELERQAQKQKGKVVPLLGNHEVMNLMGDLRYVTPEIYATFATSQSEQVRERAYRDYLQSNSRHPGHGHAKVSEDETSRQNWMKEHPLVYFEYRDALGPRGNYGRWLRNHHAIVQAGNGLFLHGGLNPSLQFRSVDALDRQVHSELADFDLIWQALSDKYMIWRYMDLRQASQQVIEEARFWQESPALEDHEAKSAMRRLLGINTLTAVTSDGPLWYRGLAQEPEENLAVPWRRC